MLTSYSALKLFVYLPLVLVVYAHHELPDDIERRDWLGCILKLVFISGGYILMIVLWTIVFESRAPQGHRSDTTIAIITGTILGLVLGAYALMLLGLALQYVRRRSWGQAACSLVAAMFSIGMIPWWWMPLLAR
jgi:hypothetical protein